MNSYFVLHVPCWLQLVCLPSCSRCIWRRIFCHRLRPTSNEFLHGSFQVQRSIWPSLPSCLWLYRVNEPGLWLSKLMVLSSLESFCPSDKSRKKSVCFGHFEPWGEFHGVGCLRRCADYLMGWNSMLGMYCASRFIILRLCCRNGGDGGRELTLSRLFGTHFGTSLCVDQCDCAGDVGAFCRLLFFGGFVDKITHNFSLLGATGPALFCHFLHFLFRETFCFGPIYFWPWALFPMDFALAPMFFWDDHAF